ncbi:MAG: hypothetical protein A3G34_02330 [Candidatus Lindowbacteria bacterium RIFCSPLOWO2_12_FULL_62_27]|nr:MAG: hypothetical protein A3I06_08910 [Candidatus Lindowbacteria bacterium RIFCSPLOWO2_02_FULL_62_12]OGH59141.1 MAG: hypothetical protein A3G34_02330 [Candidatus Lindowbacteria bacterium RIFCSPLOWO2_12_FULL_62_27]
MVERPDLDAETRTALIRKGNEYMNRGELDLAERIFLTAGYSDGIRRLADYHFRKKKNVRKALELYRAIGGKEEEALYELIAMGIKRLLAEN